MSTRSPNQIHQQIRSKYAAVASQPEGHFSYPTGHAGATGLGYTSEQISIIPPEVVQRFVGVGNPLSISPPQPGESVLDIGCGAGFDCFLAKSMVGPTGGVVGIDLTEAMLAPAQGAAEKLPDSPQFLVGDAADLPFSSASFDLVISNGVLNLVPDKDAVYREIRRVLRPGGRLAFADLLVVATIPDDVLNTQDAWSSWVAGAIRGRDCLDRLLAAGFATAEVIGPTGYATSRFTAAYHLLAVG